MRLASAADLPDLLRIDAACFAQPWTEAGWRAELDTARQRPLLRLIGEPAVGLVSAPMLGDRCELRRIAVLAEARGRGLGRDLLTSVLAAARTAGCARVELEVAATNHAALALYRHAGFCEVGRRPRYYRDPPADALLLTLEFLAPNPD